MQSHWPLGPDLYADVEARMIGNRPKDISSSQDQSNIRNNVTYNSNRKVGPEDGSGVIAREYTFDNSCQQTSVPLVRTTLEQTPHQLVKQSRLQSLDILRGITIIFMVLVNTQGADPFEQLAHIEWFGYTLADWVFPNFIFMVGMAVAIVLSPKKLVSMSQVDSSNSITSTTITTLNSKPSFWRRHQSRIKMHLKIVKRSTLLFGIGIGLSSFELIGELAETRWLRIPGVLQRISFCYFVLATTVLWSPVRYKQSNSSKNARAPLDASSATPPNYLPSRRVQIGLPLVCTALWFTLTYAVRSSATEPIPECAYPKESLAPDGQVLAGSSPLRGQLSPQWCTAQAFLDTVLFTRGRNPNHPVFDSEGTVGSLMAVVTAWFGWMIGTAVLEQQQLQKANESRVLQEAKLQMTIDDGQDIRNDARFKDHSGRGGSIPEKDMLDWLDFQRHSFLLAHLGQWFMAGVCVMFSGVVLGWILPICKGLWTPSFTLYSAGISINALCILMYLYDVTPKPSAPSLTPTSPTIFAGGVGAKILCSLGEVFHSCGRTCTHLLICYGRNPTLIYASTDMVKLVLEKIHVDGKYDWIQTAWSYIFFNSFITFMPPAWASLVFSLVYVLIFAPLVWYLNKKGRYLRV